MSYIENIFTKIINKELFVEFLQETDYTIVIKDKYPQADVHLLVLPKNNYSDLKDFLNNASSEEILDYFDIIKDQLNQLKHAKILFNNGKESGQEIFHLHCHIMMNIEK